MPTVKQILEYLYSVAPRQYQMEWDNIGLMCGRCDTKVTKILVALDATKAVAEEAKQLGCELVVTHHPLIFEALQSVTDATQTGKRLLTYLQNGLSVISMHTNLDCAPGGVNDVLADCLLLQQVQTLQGDSLLRYGEVEAQTLPQFLSFVKDRLSCEGLRYVDAGRPVRRVAVGGGSCGGYLTQLPEIDCDTFVTADVRYHQFVDAAELGINLIDAGHFETENPVVWMLRAKLAARYPQVNVQVSQEHRDVTRFA